MAFKLTDVVDVQPQSGTWIQFKDTSFKVLIAYYGKPQMRELGDRCTVKEFSTSQGKVVERLDNDRFRKEYASAVIKDWKGLTLNVLRKLVVLKTGIEVPSDAEFECNEEHRNFLILQSLEFDTWLQQMCTDVENFNAEKQKDEEKNS